MNTELLLWLFYEVFRPVLNLVIPAFVGFALLMVLTVIAVKTLLFNADLDS